MAPHRRRALAGAAALVLALGLMAAGCGGDDAASDADGTDGSAGASLPLEERVVPGDLAGMTSPEGAQLASTPEEFIEIVPTRLSPRRRRWRRRRRPCGPAASSGRSQSSMEGRAADEPFGVSSAIVFESSEAAARDADRLFAGFTEGAPPGVVEGSLPGVDGSRTLELTDTAGAASFGFASVLFTDGPILYAVLGGGPGGDSSAVIAAAQELAERVAEQPPP